MFRKRPSISAGFAENRKVWSHFLRKAKELSQTTNRKEANPSTHSLPSSLFRCDIRPRRSSPSFTASLYLAGKGERIECAKRVRSSPALTLDPDITLEMKPL